MSWTHVAAVAIAAFAAAAVIVMLARVLAARHQVLDHPTDRGLHSAPIPRGGGIGIVLVVAAGLLFHGHSFVLPWCAAALVIAVTGFFDDVRHLSTTVRLTIQLAAAIAACVAYGAFEGLWRIPFGVAAAVLTIVWIVGFTNAFNFMDGSNGIAGMQAMIAGAAWAAIGHDHGNALLLDLGVLTAAASAGFLLHNWSPARIFMGDVGSTFLGFTLAVAGLWDAAVRRDALVPALVVWPFLFDSVFTFLRRLRKRENVFAAHRSHLYQRLILSGWSHAAVALLYGALAAAGGFTAVGLDRGALAPAAAVAVTAALAAGLWLLTLRVEGRRRASPPAQS